MKLGWLGLAAFALFVSGPVFATSRAWSVAVTGATNPAATEIFEGLPANWVLEVMGVLPVVGTVTGTAASMSANVRIGPSSGFNLCGTGSPSCSNDVWAGQWTIVSAPTGIQAVNAYQGSSIRLVNTGVQEYVSLRCQVGQMIGSCIFVLRAQPISDPVF